jgi:hypothetical protein
VIWKRVTPVSYILDRYFRLGRLHKTPSSGVGTLLPQMTWLSLTSKDINQVLYLSLNIVSKSENPWELSPSCCLCVPFFRMF